MPHFTTEFLDELTARADLPQVVSRYTQLTSRGDRLWALCPFHGEKTASFTVSPEKQQYYCFGCGKGGGVIQFIMDIEHLEFPDAVEFLAEMFNMEVPHQEDDRLLNIRRRILEANKLAARFFCDQLANHPTAEVAAYVKKRALQPSTIRRFGIGYAPDSWNALTDYLRSRGYAEHELVEGGLARKGERSVYDYFRNRLMFPIIDVRGNVVAFGGRVLSGEANGMKYLNTNDTPVFRKKNNLFAYQMAKKSGSDKILLVEGYMDVVSLHQAGFPFAVASLGTALTEEQARMLSKAAGEIIISYDTDAAGTAATERAVKIISQVTDKTVRILRVPGGKDPDEFIRTNGPEAFERVLQRCDEQMEFRLAALKNGLDMKNDEDRISYIRKAAQLLTELSSKLEVEIYAGRVAESAGVTRDAVVAEVESLRKKQRKSEQKKQHADDLSVDRRLQPPRETGVRYDQPVAARFEEGLIALVADHPELAKKAALRVQPEDFTAEPLRTIFFKMLETVGDGDSLNMSVFQNELEDGGVRLLSRIMAADHPHTNPEQELTDLCAAITKRRTFGGDGTDPLMKLIQMKNKTRDGGSK